MEEKIKIAKEDEVILCETFDGLGLWSSKGGPAMAHCKTIYKVRVKKCRWCKEVFTNSGLVCNECFVEKLKESRNARS